MSVSSGRNALENAPVAVRSPVVNAFSTFTNSPATTSSDVATNETAFVPVASTSAPRRTDSVKTSEPPDTTDRSIAPTRGRNE